jgi:hypothetical protein
MIGKALKVTAIVLPAVALLAVGPFLRTGAGNPDATSHTLGRQVSFTIDNDTGVEADALQIEFMGEVGNAQKNILSTSHFKNIVPVMKSNVLQLNQGRVLSGEKVTLTLLSNSYDLNVKDYQWVRQGVLIGGKSRLVEVVEQVTTKETVSVDSVQQEHDLSLVPLTFELSNNAYTLFAQKNGNIFTNGVIAIKDQIKFDQLMTDIARLDAKKAKERQKLEAELAKLQVKSPMTGTVKELSFEIKEETLKVTMQIQPMATMPTAGVVR